MPNPVLALQTLREQHEDMVNRVLGGIGLKAIMEYLRKRLEADVIHREEVTRR